MSNRVLLSKAVILTGWMFTWQLASAEVITFRLSGSIASNTDDGALAVSPGDPFAMTFSFDSAAADTNAVPGIGNYAVDLASVTLQLGLLPLYTAPISASIMVVNDNVSVFEDFGDFEDAYAFKAMFDLGDGDNLDTILILGDEDGTALASEVLPTSPLDLTPFDNLTQSLTVKLVIQGSPEDPVIVIGQLDSFVQINFCGDGTVQNPNDDGIMEECDDGNNDSNDGCSATCVIEFCGDGITQDGIGEVCDDGNTDENDLCNNNCEPTVCGDGIVQDPNGVGNTEECDDGNNDSNDGCSATCVIEFCGDGITQDGIGEVCDDGNTDENDLCNNNCEPTVCGDGIVQDPNGVGNTEECDDGNNDSNDGCSATCVIEFCGDGITQDGIGEVCDDGNTDENDLCNNNCEPTVCGDGIVQDPNGVGNPEECDDGNNDSNDGCSATCVIEFCGDGITQDGIGEVCDDGNTDENDLCNNNCEPTVCGDGIVQDPNGVGNPEECDDGNNDSNDGCSATCVIEFCGDGITQDGIGEVCDDGNTDENDLCNNNCEPTVCGDGIVQDPNGVGNPEECDDGNNDSNDGCSATCVIEFCGDGITQDGIGEVCDDGNTDENDLCNNNCEPTVCGDGIVQDPNGVGNPEECDDGNNDSNDGCSATCVIEFCGDGITQDGIGEVCDDGNTDENDLCNNNCEPTVCGDGIVQDPNGAGNPEECDDGNNDSNDGCSATCVIEFCGDGITQDGIGEVCDDGNTDENDLCNNNCEPTVCGDGIVQDPNGVGNPEECDDGNNDSNDGCSATCVIEFCGDGITQDGIGEVCDDGNTDENDLCNNNCEPTVCGDGIVQDPNGVGNTEECDDGNNDSNDGCSATCVIEFCGDGIKQTGEKCDDGNSSNKDKCTIYCDLTICGDGIIQTPNGTGQDETCDDGNNSNADACNNWCQPTFCGDGILQDPNADGQSEECDDGNNDNNDGCSEICLPEFCGDGIVQDGELCDDGNSNNADQCSDNCEPTVCGDGIVQEPNGNGVIEQCDDGNNVDGDGCSADCMLELGDDDCDDDKPCLLTMLYTGEGCAASNNSQDEDKVLCEGNPEFAEEVYIISNNKSDPQDGDVWFSGWVELNHYFDISAANGGKDKLAGNTYVHIFDAPGGPLLQLIKFHTSCSEPLEIGEQFGSLVIAGFLAEGNCPDGGDGLCEDGKPCELVMTYTGEDCSASNNTQDPDKVECLGDPKMDPLVFIIANDDEDPNSGDVWFSGEVSLDGMFALAAGNAGQDKLGTNTYVHIFDEPGGTLLQFVKFHTSCSQPLNIGDQFGSLVLSGFTPEDNCTNDGGGGGTDLCDDGKPCELGLTYTGEDCSASNNTQDPDKVDCEGDPMFASTVYIIANDDDTPGAGNVWFTGTVALNQTFTLSAAAAGEDRLKSNTYVYIYDEPGGTLLQSIRFHTSCSQPLSIGDQFGSLVVADFVPEDNCPADGGDGGDGGGDLCDDGKPCLLTLTYTGEDCSFTSHSQDPDKVACEGDPAFAEMVYIIAGDKSKPQNGNIWFEGFVLLNQTFDLESANGDEDKLSSNTFVRILDAPDGNLLQFVKFHTSCSQPLFLGNQFGSLVVTEFVPEDDCDGGDGGGNPPGTDLCDDGKPCIITMRYTGEDCSFTQHSQDPDKVSCSGDPEFAPTVYIIANDDEDPTEDPMWFSGLVALDETFDISAASGGASNLKSETFIHIFSAEQDAVLQTIRFHTSCSQPLILGNQFGSLVVTEFVPEDDCDGGDGGGNPQGTDLCDDGKPCNITMRYTGEDCSVTQHAQDPGKVSCSGDPGFAPAVYIIANDDEDPTEDPMWFSGPVALDEEFDISAASGGASKLKSETFIHIFSAEQDSVLQTIRFHTSCSQPLIMGNQFGAAQLVGFVVEGNCDPPPSAGVPGATFLPPEFVLQRLQSPPVD